MTGSEKEKKMELLHRAVGQIEGVAFFQSEVVRDLMMGAAEDITSGVEAMQSQIMAAEEDRLLATTKISRLMKDKDDLLTENGKLREQLHSDNRGVEIATSASPPRNDKTGERIATTPAGSRNDSGNWRLVVEDVKSDGTRTREYGIKRKLMAEKYGVQIREV